MTCKHIDKAGETTKAKTPEGCAECLQMGDTWVHLRLCLTCGHVGCCDSSKNKHATAHFKETGHPVIRSFQPGEHWLWCYVDELVAE
ncbi:MAG: UBP-type zinc finger domain-containing protein [Patescibacteria group bacterium]